MQCNHNHSNLSDINYMRKKEIKNKMPPATMKDNNTGY